MTSDDQLIRQIIMAKPEAYQAFVEKYQNQMYSVCLSILKTPNEAQEAAQDTFIKAFKAIKTYNSNSKMSSWLYKIAYRTSLDYLRKRKSTTDLEVVDYSLKGENSNAEESLEKSELAMLLLKALDYLKPDEAGLIRMFYLEEMTIKELEEITGMGKSNIKVKLFRTRKKLTEIIREHFTELESYFNS